MTNENFYQTLPTFHDFSGITDTRNYQAVPEDWVVVLTDIKGSTNAIQQGRYKDVNMVGAACIVAVTNACKPVKIPYVFGGDGATLLIPPSKINDVTRVLVATHQLSHQSFQLDLRIGIVPVRAIHEQNKEIYVAKYELSPGNYLAMFRGGGLELADYLVKNPTSQHDYHIDITQYGKLDAPDLGGLSCRWEPLTAKKDQMLTLLVLEREHTNDTQNTPHSAYHDILHHIHTIVSQHPESHLPVADATMRFVWPPKGLMLEAKTQQHKGPVWWNLLTLYVESFVQYLCNRNNWCIGNFHAADYREELKSNADFQKFDDMLRMVIDCTSQEISDILAYLDRLYKEGHIIYGSHVSNHALMTCFVSSLLHKEHVHFIDGADGGYAVAAIQLKQQLSDLQAKENPEIT